MLPSVYGGGVGKKMEVYIKDKERGKRIQIKINKTRIETECTREKKQIFLRDLKDLITKSFLKARIKKKEKEDEGGGEYLYFERIRRESPPKPSKKISPLERDLYNLSGGDLLWNTIEERIPHYMEYNTRDLDLDNRKLYDHFSPSIDNSNR